MRRDRSRTPREGKRRKLHSHPYPKQAGGLEGVSFLANDLTSVLTAMETLTVILNALGDLVQFSDGKGSQSLW